MSHTRYVVRRLSWAPSGHGDRTYFYDAGSDGVHSGLPVRAFPDRAAAERCCRELEAEARQLVHPGRVTVDGHLDGDDAAAWRERVAALGLPPPEPTRTAHGDYLDNPAVLRWWAAHAPAAGPELRAAVWESLPGPRFFDVVEVPLED